ncbi:hypothetical protein PPGU19_092110 (plasmid) [Paraburkholderia sp. PGU19]|uniref:hypothetical protein n=1 Tax=Paraburkholderia sp. PGU19 TaxID=2735434 RepID=UPI0015DA1288|nr:hypothetical protein [Paraburkholderia sp. PGU19]BCG04643.1 hypothetical protein PPGU19_092110 [Paraburkholderia sp. PGU19]
MFSEYVVRTFASLALVSCLAPTVAIASEPAPVTVKLSDGHDGKMSLTIKPAEVQAGPVEFRIVNQSHALKHEFMILPWSGSDSTIPYDPKTAQIEEGKLNGLQGVEDLDPRATVVARFTLKQGHYIVFCNEPGHFRHAMSADLVVSSGK